MARLLVTALTHDLAAKTSRVTLRWDDDPGKVLSREVADASALADAGAAARNAVRRLAAELAAIEVATAPVVDETET
ncbi:hypothetical protein [Acuticoccus mangrovi]|uniref:Uncharacterized protein n=1 Tax=Acuticoccus mangrovi TaxID=2796142 RepID=A0A934MGP9_9HYPH|nr:hypothetical protein [Acuticoccus mangrovi]MBJ3775226.1 hypothetical protein [Acuticoccus mangrovi]